MTDQHPITPPPELVEQWWKATMPDIETSVKDQLCTQAARWGADQELEWCVSYVDNNVSGNKARALRDARRPKPPSLAEQALMALEDGDLGPGASLTPVEVCIIRTALERLQELEHND